MKAADILTDLAPFADLGEDAPEYLREDNREIVRMVRNGERRIISITADQVTEQIGSKTRKFKTVSGLLASSEYADLGRWADSQKILLEKIVATEDIPISGRYNTNGESGAVDTVDMLLAKGSEEFRRSTIVLLDGPAGIGKTSIIRALAYRRAKEFRKSSLPLLLHVESRGRVLQNITDLMAFSLQSMRLRVTYDQVPTLVKYGLVTLSIDGFDELGDPNGYDLAWAQLNDFVEATRGGGSFLLSGRETFISGPRIEKALPVIDLHIDSLEKFTVSAIPAQVARSWLRDRGWNSDALEAESARALFEDGGYALRPFFLSQLAQPGVADDISNGIIDDTLSFLTTLMLSRESRKFGKDVEAVTSEQERISFISELMQEVARDLAENQTDAISSDTVAWLSDTASQNLPAGVQGILRNRADVVAFLTKDDRVGYRKFIHEEVQNYFLALSVIKSITDGEVPKYIRRNILGMDFLESFVEIVRYRPVDEVNNFIKSSCRALLNLADVDRSKRNIASIILAACSVSEPEFVPVISDVSIDEAYISETSAEVILKRVTIAQMDARGADFRSLQFEDCSIVTLIGDDRTIPSQSVPRPSVLALPGGNRTMENEIESWFADQYYAVVEYSDNFELSRALLNIPIFKLLARFVRYKPFWLKGGEDKSARRIIDDPNWPTLLKILRDNDLILERDDVPASGKKATFYHLKNKASLSDWDNPGEQSINVFRDMFKSLDQSSS